jgi:ABC-type sugar transport system ATPase subunit
MNLLRGRLVGDGGSLRFRHEAFAVSIPPPLRAALERRDLHDGVVLGVRPAEIRLTDDVGAACGEVFVWEPLGKFAILTVRLGPDVVKLKIAKSRGWTPGESVRLDLGAAEPVLFDAATGAAV